MYLAEAVHTFTLREILDCSIILIHPIICLITLCTQLSECLLIIPLEAVHNLAEHPTRRANKGGAFDRVPTVELQINSPILYNFWRTGIDYHRVSVKSVPRLQTEAYVSI